MGIKNVEVIPNGVNMSLFSPIDNMICKNELNWDSEKKQILFPSDPRRYEKNFLLAKEAFSLLDDVKYELKILVGIPAEKVPIYINAADLILLTSRWEGSPNVVKEAMACNKPILSTDVGDVSYLFSEIEGCDIINLNIEYIVKKIKRSISDYQFSNGRKKLKSLKLDSRNIAINIIKLYKKIKNGK